MVRRRQKSIAGPWRGIAVACLSFELVCVSVEGNRMRLQCCKKSTGIRFAVRIAALLFCLFFTGASPDLRAQDALSEAEAIVKAAGSLPESLTAATLLVAEEKWFVGTSWAGEISWYSDKRDSWLTYGGSAFIVTFLPDNQCFVLRGDDDKRTVSRSETTWREEGDTVVVGQISFAKNVVFPMSASVKSKRESDSKEWRNTDRQRVSIRKDWGLKLIPPTISYTGYRWVRDYEKCDHMRADP